MHVDPSSGRMWKWMLATAGLVIVVAVAIGYSRTESNREPDLSRLPIESLARLDAQPNANAQVHFVYARRLFDSGHSDEARVPVTRAVDAASKSPKTELAARAFALAGCVAADLGAVARAEGLFQQTEQIRSDDFYVDLGRGTLALQAHRAADAVARLTAASRKEPLSSEAWKRLGQAYLNAAEPDIALEALRRAEHLNPSDPLIHASLGQVLLQLKQFGPAEAEYATVAGLQPSDAYYAAMPARIGALAARTDSDYQRASERLQAALAQSPNDDGLRAELAGLEIRFNQFSLARKELDTILTHNPLISTDCWYNLYTVCKRLADQQGAAEAHKQFDHMILLKNAVADLTIQAEQHPTDARAYLRLSVALLQLRQIDKAYAALTRAAKLDPNDPEIAQAMQGAQAILRSQQGAGGIGGGVPQQ